MPIISSTLVQASHPGFLSSNLFLFFSNLHSEDKIIFAKPDYNTMIKNTHQFGINVWWVNSSWWGVAQRSTLNLDSDFLLCMMLAAFPNSVQVSSAFREKGPTLSPQEGSWCLKRVSAWEGGGRDATLGQSNWREEKKIREGFTSLE